MLFIPRPLSTLENAKARNKIFGQFVRRNFICMNQVVNMEICITYHMEGSHKMTVTKCEVEYSMQE